MPIIAANVSRLIDLSPDSVAEVARRAQVGRGTLIRVMEGANPDVWLGTLAAIARALEVSVVDLLIPPDEGA